MKLAGHIGHGPYSSYPDLCPDMSCCHGIMTENVLKNGQMNVRIVKSQEEMAKIHSYHDTWQGRIQDLWKGGGFDAGGNLSVSRGPPGLPDRQVVCQVTLN